VIFGRLRGLEKNDQAVSRSVGSIWVRSREWSVTVSPPGGRVPMVAALKVEVKVDVEVKRIRSRSRSRLNLEP
jgi:hypothetical protein